MKTRRIGFFNDTFPFSGMENVTQSLSLFFNRQGYKVFLYTRDLRKDTITAEQKNLFEFRSLPDRKHIESEENTLFLTQQIQEDLLDYIIVQGESLFPFKTIKEQTDCKILFCIHGSPMWEVNEQVELKKSKQSSVWAKLKWAFIQKPHYMISSVLGERVLHAYLEPYPYLDKLILLDKGYENDFRLLLGVTPDDCHITTVGNPLPTLEYTPESKEKTVLYVGILRNEHKRIDRLLEIWKKIQDSCPEWKLQIVGTGPDEKMLKMIAESMGAKRVEFTGYVDNVYPYYNAASILCLTSNIEGLPLAIMEAQFFGTVPFTFGSYKGAYSLIDSDKNGYILPPFHLGEYAKQLKLLMESPEKLQEMRLNALEKAKEYDLNAIGQKWLSIFDSIDNMNTK